MADGRLTTHVLDTTHGCPAAGLRLALSLMHGDHGHLLAKATTNEDGRLAQPLLEGAEMRVGLYELVFEVGAYFAARGTEGAGAFLDTVPVRFAITDPGAHYHVPLLVSPFGYSTYRGS